LEKAMLPSQLLQHEVKQTFIANGDQLHESLKFSCFFSIVPFYVVACLENIANTRKKKGT